MPKPRLDDVVRIIASHAGSTGKHRLVGRCVSKLDERCRTGRVRIEEKERLIRILRGEVAEAGRNDVAAIGRKGILPSLD